MLQVYVKGKRKSVCCFHPTDIQVAGTALSWLGRMNWPAQVERGPAAQPPGLQPMREGSKTAWIQSSGCGKSCSLSELHFIRPLEKFHLKQNLLSPESCPEWPASSPDHCRRLRASPAALRPPGLGPLLAHSCTPRVSLRGQGGQALPPGCSG